MSLMSSVQSPFSSCPQRSPPQVPFQSLGVLPLLPLAVAHGHQRRLSSRAIAVAGEVLEGAAEPHCSSGKPAIRADSR